MRHFGVRVTDRFRLDRLRTVILENELLRVTFLVDQGCDIIELLYKPKDMDFLWRSPQGVRRREHSIATAPTQCPFLDYYEGGWQELFPHAGGPIQYANAQLGCHGEVWGLPWDYEILTDRPEEVTVRFWVRTERFPFYLERTVSLRSQESILRFHEVVRNESNTPLDFMWGHHPTFGRPFLDEQCVLTAPARKVQVGDKLVHWPVDRDGTDHSRLARQKSDSEVMKYLHELRDGWVALTNPKRKLGVAFVFDTRVFRYVWLWHEFEYTAHYPWFGRAYVLGVEPQSSMPDARKKNGRLLHLKGEGKIETDLLTVVYEGSAARRVTPQGRVLR